MRIKKLLVAGLSAIAIITVAAPASFAAQNNEYGFSFNIKANQGNTRSVGRSRTTNHMWMVNAKTTNESGSVFHVGTKTTFWLENKGGTNVSPSTDVVVGNGAYYQQGYDNSKTTVYLTAQNNNYNSNTYYVHGVWDEETTY